MSRTTAEKKWVRVGKVKEKLRLWALRRSRRKGGSSWSEDETSLLEGAGRDLVRRRKASLVRGGCGTIAV